VVTTTDDITAHVHAQEKLRESEEKYRDLVEKISDVIYAVDTEGVISYVSPAFESLIGLSPEQAVGQKLAQFAVSEDVGRIGDRFQSLMSGVSSGPGEYRVLTQSGDVRWMRVSGQPIMDGGRVTGVQGVLTDITERKRVEEQREEAAAASERARLARDLHDAVTQTLFSVAAIAEALPRVWERDLEEARRGLEELRWMARGALAEMRTMLLELRPSALIEQDLGTLVAQLAEATMGRTRMCVTSEIEGTCKLPADVQLGLYRIAQEALNNVARHARSSQVQVLLTCQPGRVQLAVQDDGQGFDPDAVGAHRMGVAIMRERAQAIGAEFSLKAAPGKGTEITVAWKGMATGTDD
jgi:PAS domain S-box-containing protein